MNATDIDTQMMMLQKQMEALKAQKEALLAPPPAPTPTPEPEPTDEEAERIERMEHEIEHYITFKMKELENAASEGFDWNSGSDSVSINIQKRESWTEDALLEELKGRMEDWVRQLSSYNDYHIDYDWEYAVSDTTIINEGEDNEEEKAIEWEITLNWSFEGLSNGLDWNYIKKEEHALCGNVESYDWDAFHTKK